MFNVQIIIMFIIMIKFKINKVKLHIAYCILLSIITAPQIRKPHLIHLFKFRSVRVDIECPPENYGKNKFWTYFELYFILYS